MTMLAAGFTSAGSQYLSIANNSTLQLPGVDAWWAGWLWLDDKNQNAWMFSKGNFSTDDEYFLLYVKASDQYQMSVWNGATPRSVNATTFGSPPTQAWVFVFGWFDAVNQTVNIQINNGAVNSAPMSGTTPIGTTQDLFVGSTISGAQPFNGRIDSLAFGKSPVGGIAGIVSAISTSLYNGGAGKTYAALTASEKTNWGLVSYWKFNEASGASRVDSHGTNNLTDHNSVSQVTGVVEDSLFPGEDEERPVLQTQSRRWFLPLSFAEEIMPLLEGPGIVTATHASIGHGPRILAKLTAAPRIRAELVLENQR